MKILLYSTRELTVPHLYEKKLKTIGPTRQAKINRLSTKKAKIQSLGAGLMIQAGLSETAFTESDVTYTEGKPAILKPHAPHFNISHSEQWILGAFDCLEVGVDLQAFRPVNLKLATRFFHPDEIRTLSKKTSSLAAQHYFIQLWTIKESIVKAKGTGLSFPFDQFYVHPQMDCVVIDQKAWYFKLFEFSNYQCCICSEAPLLRVKPQILTNTTFKR